MRVFSAVPRQIAGFVAAVRRTASRPVARVLVAVLSTAALDASPVRAQDGAKGTRVAAPPKNNVAKTSPVRAEALPTRVDYVPQGRYDELRDFVVRSRATGGTLFTSPDGQTSYMMVLRTRASDVEEHSRWDDLIIVRSGSGAVEIGPKTTGARVLAPGELRGGTITAPSRLTLRPGDIARIPAGIPHVFVPDEAEPWEFLLVKVRRPSKPLKRAPGDEK